jgi:hypothetical protein
MSAICELPGGIITKNDTLFVLVTDDTRLWIRELAARRQCQLKEYAVTFEPDDTAANETATLLYGSPCGFIQTMPELLDAGMRSTPSSNERLDFVISEPIWIKFAPSYYSAAVAQSKIGNLADAAFRVILCVGAARPVEYLASRDAVGLITGIVGGIKPAIAVELPSLTSNPCQNSAFNRAKISADQYLTRCCTDYWTGAISDDC